MSSLQVTYIEGPLRAYTHRLYGAGPTSLRVRIHNILSGEWNICDSWCFRYLSTLVCRVYNYYQLSPTLQKNIELAGHTW